MIELITPGVLYEIRRSGLTPEEWMTRELHPPVA
jgi:hypothetical protein